MDPPPCVQNAMMKQTKKPFTYTPGGIDLSEIKSPRMQRRIERNANFPGVNEIPQQSQSNYPQQPTGPLPPSALAAMQPQIQVQVLPGIPPPPPGSNKAGPPPPPPPPPANIPPPPPLQPLPTQKVCLNNEVLERPDMTKIIPDNPMALLKKTGGPKQRNSFAEEMYNVKPQQHYSPPAQQQPQYQPPPPKPQYQPQPPQPQPQPPQPQWSSPQVQNDPQPRWPQPNSQPQPQPQRWVQNDPQELLQNRWGINGTAPSQNQPQTTTWSPPAQAQKSPHSEPQTWSPPIIERQLEKPVKTSTAHLGSLYIPPINQQQQQQQRTATPPTPPKRDTQSPQIQSPSLKEAPKPWQKQTKVSEEIPPWAKRDPPETIIRGQDTSPEPQKHPNAVYVTQPVVLQHPGPPPPHIYQQQQQSPKVDAQGARVIPIKIENGQRQTQPTTPGANERFSRQQSWGSNPIQSNSFKILQRLTNTDGDEDDESEPIVEHPPKYTQQFQQAPPGEQLRKLKLTEGDRELMNRFKQGVDEENSLHNEVDPRYRGAAIPSKAFKLLQSMTDGSSDSPTVSRGSPSTTPQVRTIPIQIERDETPAKPYVHPSEQTVPEPKKYTGSSIPSRSFKILQAMTADNCANANEVNENYDPYQWGCYEPYPILYPAFPPPYCYNIENNNTENKNERSCKTPAPPNENNLRQTPLPWAYYPPPSYENQNEENLRSKTPIMWGYYPYPVMPQFPPKSEEGGKITPVPFMYYPCYLMPAPPPPQQQEYEGYYPYPTPTWDTNWYFDENEMNKGTEEETEEESQENLNVASIIEKFEKKKEESPKECLKIEEERKRTFNSLKAIKSVKDIRVYDNSEDEDEDHIDEEVSIITVEDEEELEEDQEEEENDEVSECTDLDSMPHQLSVIFEESENSKRATSVLSDTTTVQDEEEEDEDENDDDNSITVSVKLSNGISFNIEEENTEIYTTFTLKSPSSTPKKDRSMCRLEDNEEDKIEENISVIKGDIKCQIKSDVNEPHIEEPKEQDEAEEEDWWSILKKDDDDIVYKRKDDLFKSATDNQEKEEQVDEKLSESSGSDSNEENTLRNNKESDFDNETDVADTVKESDVELYKNHSIWMKNTKNDNKNEFKFGEEIKSEIELRKEFQEDDDSLFHNANVEENKKQFYEMQCSITNETNSPIKETLKINYSNVAETILKLEEEKNSTNTKTFFRRNSVKESVLAIEGMFQEPTVQVTRRNSNTPVPKSFQMNLPASVGIKTEILDDDDDDDTSSASSRDSSSSESHVSNKRVLSSVEDNNFNKDNEKVKEKEEGGEEEEKEEEEEEKQPITVKDRIEALRARIAERQMRLNKQKEDFGVCGVQNKITAFEKTSEKTSNKSSIKSFEEYSEEEGDSGVTSDMSRHNISDEEYPELRKMNRYQRAATHSRLFKLLQEGNDDENDNSDIGKGNRRDNLNLPLTSDDSLNSSGLVSPVPSLINEKLVNELVHSMLKKKKCQQFNDLPIDKLEMAARKVLLENIEVDTISDDSFLLSQSLGSTPAQTPQEFLNFSDYKPYYESWNIKNDSKSHKVLQEHRNSMKYQKNSFKPTSKSPSPEKTEVTSTS